MSLLKIILPFKKLITEFLSVLVILSIFKLSIVKDELAMLGKIILPNSTSEL